MRNGNDGDAAEQAKISHHLGGAANLAVGANDAPARRGRRIGLALFVSCVALVAGVASAEASKSVLLFFGNASGSGAVGGEFNQPRSVAVNVTGAGTVGPGTIYVVDDFNHRVQRFDSTGSFERAWGRDVIAPGNPGDLGDAFEICTVAADCKAGSFGTTTDAPAGELDNPQGIAVDQTDGSVYVSDRDNRRVQKFDADGNFVLTWGRDVDSGGGTGFEVCTVPANCQIGASGSLGGEFATTFSGHLAVAPAAAPNAGNVIVADPGNRRVQEFTSAGSFVRTFGFDVAGPDAGADNTGTGFEVCTEAVAGAVNCKVGAASGSGTGQFATNQPTRVAADSTGAIYTVENTVNFRVQRFTPQAGPPVLTPAIFAAATLSGTAATDTPTDVAVGASDDVFVIKAFAAGTTPSCPSGSPSVAERRVLELDSSGSPQDAHMACAGINVVNGLGLEPSAGRIFVSSTTGGHRIYVLDDVAAPTATIAPVTDIGAHGATFNGSVNPSGSETGYHFEYRRESDPAWTSLPTPDASVGNTGTADTPVAETATGLLQANTLYHLRLIAAKPFGAGTAVSPELTFTTSTSPPTVASSGATTGATTATLRGRIQPQNSASTYRFEYGLDATYGAAVPVPDGDAGTGSGLISVSEEISGLEPNTTYHFRLVATNEAGITNGPDRTFTTLSGVPPGVRAYEQVSPPDKNGADIANWAFTSTQSDAVGDAVVYGSLGGFADTPSAGLTSFYRATRGPSGWSSRGISPPLPTLGLEIISSEVSFLSPDLSGAIFRAFPAPPDLPGTQPDAFNYYRQQNIPDGSYELLNPPPPSPFGFRNSDFADATDDLTHVLFETNEALTPDAPVGTAVKTYESIGGELRLVGILPDGTPTAPAQAGASANGQRTRNSISDNGSRVFFTALSEVFVRENGATTLHASASQRTIPDPRGPRPAFFLGAASDGSSVIFRTDEQLIDTDIDLTQDLYRYQVGPGTLTRLSVDGEPLDGTAAAVRGAVGASEDLSRVYFAADGRLVAGQPAVPGTHIYLWHDDAITYVATLDPATDSDNWSEFTRLLYGNVAVSPSGRYLLFTSRRQLTGYDNAGHAQLYRYDAQADQLECASCNPSGDPATADAQMRDISSPIDGIDPDSHSGRNINDGGRVFFETPERLVPHDSNAKVDVYQWEDGEVGLISSGQSDADSRFADASADGDSVFFLTRERLVGSDIDGNVDLYVARTDGGFPQLPVPPPCQGDECREPPLGAPQDPTAGSGTFVGPPNPSLGRSCATLARRAQRLRTRARVLSRRARKASGPQGRRLRARARKSRAKARRASANAKRCRARRAQ